MIIDLGSDKRYTKKAKLLILGDLKILPICIGCSAQIEEGKQYITNDSGSLAYHPNGFCKDLAERNHVNHYKDF